jgi:hypothetical protein
MSLLYPRSAPILRGRVERLAPAELLDDLLDPAVVRPGSTITFFVVGLLGLKEGEAESAGVASERDSAWIGRKPRATEKLGHVGEVADMRALLGRRDG